MQVKSLNTFNEGSVQKETEIPPYTFCVFDVEMT